MRCALLLLLLSLCWACEPPLPAEGPEQPFAYSHQLHVQKLAIDCRYCHSRVSRSAEANLPALATCMGCHAGIVAERASTEMLRLQSQWEKRQPVAWIKVNDLPDHVHFHHGRHVGAGVSCATCHGDVQTMARVRRTQAFSMAWCLDCHRREGAGQDCLVCHK